jgi:hypothetical protein
VERNPSVTSLVLNENQIGASGASKIFQEDFGFTAVSSPGISQEMRGLL